jgi:release factor glutamine methyltransferase
MDFKVLGKILNAIGETSKNIYYPSDDSFLILSAISELALEGRKVLDVGTGSGLLGLYCAMRGAIVTIADIDEMAIRHAVDAAEKLGVTVNANVSDVFSNVVGQFDLVLFNPPYLPSRLISDKAVDGGLKGRNLIERFLRDLPKHLERHGTALLVVSSLNESTSLIEAHPEFRLSIEKKRSLFFEELQVLSLRFREDFTAQ